MYIAKFAGIKPEMKGLWDGTAWVQANVLEVADFRPEGSDHRPGTSAKLLYDSQGIYGIFKVDDRFVRCVYTRYSGPVYKDSCVEFFVKPKPDRGYFNFEFNCGGTILSSYITNPKRTSKGFEEFVPLPESDGSQVAVYHSMPGMVDPEIRNPVTWRLEFFIPFVLLEKYAGPLDHPKGKEWKANFYKCGDETSHPHWASWRPVPALNFHMPEYFGSIRFEK